MAQLREELSALVSPAHPGNAHFYEFHSNESGDPSAVLFHALGQWRITPGFHDLLWNPAVVVPAAQLLGSAIRLWHDQLFCKPARHGLSVHGSYANQTDLPRRATVVNLFRDGTHAASEDTLLPGVPPVPKGQALGPPFFPLLHDPAWERE